MDKIYADPPLPRYPFGASTWTWTAHEEHRLVDLLIAKTFSSEADQVGGQQLSEFIKEISPFIHIDIPCAPPRTNRHCVDKLVELVWWYETFLWLIKAPGINYDAQSHTIEAKLAYFLLVVPDTEPLQVELIREKPLEIYGKMEILFGRGFGLIYYPWVLMQLSKGWTE